MQHDQYRIVEISECRRNGKDVKQFKAYKLQRSEFNIPDYVYCGTFYAPAKTKNADLVNFIEQ